MVDIPLDLYLVPYANLKGAQQQWKGTLKRLCKEAIARHSLKP